MRRHFVALVTLAVLGSSLALPAPMAAASTARVLVQQEQSGAGEEQEPTGSPFSQQDPDYRIGPRDRIQVTVAGMEDLDTQATVDENGSIRMSLVGDFQVAGYTTRELEEVLAEALRRYVTDPEVRVTVTGFGSQSFFMYGAVNGGGSYPITGKITLLEALVTAGGINQTEAEGTIRIIRRAFAMEPLEVDGHALFFEGNRAYDIEIEPGDMINVIRKPSFNIYIYHDSGTGGAFSFREPPTLLQAISMIGGLGRGAKDEVRIVRRQQDGPPEEFLIDFPEILEGRADDFQLEAGDVVIIRAGGFFN